MKQSLGKALKRAFRQEDLLSKVVPRTGGGSTQLMHPTRMAIFSRLTFRPCSHPRALARDAGVSAPVSSWHCARLAEAGLLNDAKVGNRLVYYPLDMVDERDIQAFALVSEEMPRKALRYVVSGTAPNQKLLARKLRTYQQEAAVVLRKLRAAGLLEGSHKGREVRYSPSPRLISMAESYEARAKEFKVNLMNALEWDGIMPKARGRKGCAHFVEVDRGTERVIESFQVNPLCEVLR